MTPKQGQFYTAQTGDTLPKIAIRAKLGNNWPLILEANQLEYKVDNQESIQPGETIYIPVDQEKIDLQNAQNRL